MGIYCLVGRFCCKRKREYQTQQLASNQNPNHGPAVQNSLKTPQPAPNQKPNQGPAAQNSLKTNQPGSKKAAGMPNQPITGYQLATQGVIKFIEADPTAARPVKATAAEDDPQAVTSAVNSVDATSPAGKSGPPNSWRLFPGAATFATTNASRTQGEVHAVYQLPGKVVVNRHKSPEDGIVPAHANNGNQDQSREGVRQQDNKISLQDLGLPEGEKNSNVIYLDFS